MAGLGHNGSYLPFGAGPRNCVGTGFALMEAMLVLAAALQRYTFKLPASAAAGEMPMPKPLLTLRPADVRVSIFGGISCYPSESYAIICMWHDDDAKHMHFLLIS